jgi:nicotinamidase-related amidase
MNTALLLSEYQNDCILQNGRIVAERSIEACDKARLVLDVFRDKKLPIFHLQHISTHADASYLLPCTKGAEFHTSLQPMKGETVIKKHYPNSFKDTPLLNNLIKNKINHLIICGMMMHLSVDATVRAAYDLGFSVTVIGDACASRQLDYNHHAISAQNVHYAFLAALQPIYANVLTVDELFHMIGTRAPMATA